MTEISVQYCTGTEQVQNQNLRITELSEILILDLQYPYNLGIAGTEIPLSSALSSDVGASLE